MPPSGNASLRNLAFFCFFISLIFVAGVADCETDDKWNPMIVSTEVTKQDEEATQAKVTCEAGVGLAEEGKIRGGASAYWCDRTLSYTTQIGSATNNDELYGELATYSGGTQATVKKRADNFHNYGTDIWCGVSNRDTYDFRGFAAGSWAAVIFRLCNSSQDCKNGVCIKDGSLTVPILGTSAQNNPSDEWNIEKGERSGVELGPHICANQIKIDENAIYCTSGYINYKIYSGCKRNDVNYHIAYDCDDGEFTSTGGVTYVCADNKVKVKANGERCYNTNTIKCDKDKDGKDGCNYTECEGLCVAKNLNFHGNCCGSPGTGQCMWYENGCCLTKNSKVTSASECCGSVNNLQTVAGGSYCCAANEIRGEAFSPDAPLNLQFNYGCSQVLSGGVLSYIKCSPAGRELKFKPLERCGSASIITAGTPNTCTAGSVITAGPNDCSAGFDFSGCAGMIVNNCTEDGSFCCDAVCRPGCGPAGTGYYVGKDDNTCPTPLACTSNDGCISLGGGGSSVLCDTAGLPTATSAYYGRNYGTSTFKHCITCDPAGNHKAMTMDYPGDTSRRNQCSVACGADTDCAFISPTGNYIDYSSYINLQEGQVCHSNCSSNLMDVLLHYVDTKPFKEPDRSSLITTYEKIRSNPENIGGAYPYGAKYEYIIPTPSSGPTAYTPVELSYSNWANTARDTQNLEACSVYAAALKIRSQQGIPDCTNLCELRLLINNNEERTYSITSGDLVSRTVGGKAYTYIISGTYSGEESKEAKVDSRSPILIPVPHDYWYPDVGLKVKFSLIQPDGRIWTGMIDANSNSAARPMMNNICQVIVPTEYLKDTDTEGHYHFCTGDDIMNECTYMEQEYERGLCRFNKKYVCDTSFRDKTKSTYSQTLAGRNAGYSNFADEPAFCNTGCSCFGSNPNCGTCDNFESDESCPTDCCDWSCEIGGTSLGFCQDDVNIRYFDPTAGDNSQNINGGIFTYDQKTLITTNANKYSSIYAYTADDTTYFNDVCHVSVTYGQDDWREWKCSKYCGADPTCHDQKPGSPGSMCDKNCESSCSRLKTENNDMLHLGSRESAHIYTTQTPSILQFQTYSREVLGESRTPTYIPPDSEFMQFLNTYRKDGDNTDSTGACDTVLGENSGTCSFDCCKVDGCMASYSKDYSDCTSGKFGVRGVNVVSGKCSEFCKVSNNPTLYGPCNGKSPGSKDCTADCLKRFPSNTDPKYGLEIGFFNSPSECFSWSNPSTNLNVPACGVKYIGVKVPYNLYCNQVPPLAAGNNPVPSCILAFNSTKYLPVQLGQLEKSSNVSFTVTSYDVSYLQLPDDVDGDGVTRTDEKKTYAVICTIGNGASPIVFPTGDLGSFTLNVNLTSYAENAAPVYYSVSRGVTTEEAQNGCNPGTYCRPSNTKSKCAGDIPCVIDYYRCLSPYDYGEVDARPFVGYEQGQVLYCCTNDDPASGCVIYTGAPEGSTYKAACHPGTTTDNAANLGLLGSGYYCDTTSTCNSYRHGYNPPSRAAQDINREIPKLEPCKVYNIGVDLDGGKAYLFEPGNFSDNGKMPKCDTSNECLIEFEIEGKRFPYRTPAGTTLSKGFNKQFLYQAQRAVGGDSRTMSISKPVSWITTGAYNLFNLFTTSIVAGTTKSKIFFVNVSGKNQTGQGVSAYGNTYYEIKGGTEDVYCGPNGPCSVDEDCAKNACPSTGKDSKAMYCNYAIDGTKTYYNPTCQCVCNQDKKCDWNRDIGEKESTTNCRFDCCNGKITVDDIGGLCSRDCSEAVDVQCNGMKPGTGMCGATGTTLECKNTCGTGTCENGQMNRPDYGETPSFCTGDCCAKAPNLEGIMRTVGYTINMTRNGADLLCDSSCINAIPDLDEETKNKSISCIRPGIAGCDKFCRLTSETEYMKPIFFDKYESYSQSCAQLVNSPTATITDFTRYSKKPGELIGCNKYYLAFLVDHKIDCGSTGCTIFISQEEGLTGTVKISSNEVVCIERAKASFAGHKFSGSNMPDLLGQNCEGPGCNYCTQWAICPASPPSIILPSVKADTAVTRYLNYSLGISSYSSFNQSYTYKSDKYYCPKLEFSDPAKQGYYCLGDEDCLNPVEVNKITCTITDHTCRDYCGNGICEEFETTAGCKEDCCAVKPGTTSYAGYNNRTGICDINCNSHQSCNGRLPNSDIILNYDRTACDQFCDLYEDSLILYTTAKPCTKDFGADACGGAGDILNGGKVELIEGQGDIYLGFSLAYKKKKSDRIENVTQYLSGMNVTIIAGDFREEHISLPAGGSYIRASAWPIGVYNATVIASHPKLIDAVVNFTIRVKRLQDVRIKVATSESGQDMGANPGFYRISPKGIMTGYGVSQAWFKVDSFRLNTTEQIQGTATCDYGPYHLVGPTGQWVNMSVYNIPATSEDMKCTVQANNYFDGTQLKHIFVRGVIKRADSEIPPEFTPGVPARMRVSKILDELSPPNEITDAEITWYISNYPSKGISTQFCTYKGSESDCVLYAGVPVGNQTLTLQVAKGQLYDRYERFIPVKINPASKYSLSLSPRSKVVSTNGGTARFIASVMNDGNVAVNLNMSLQANQPLMNATAFRLAELQVFPGLVKDQQILFNIPAGPEANYTFNVTVLDVSKNVSQSLEGNITVTTQTIRQVSLLSPRNLTIILGADETLDTDLIVSNDGNVNDNYKLTVSGSGAKIASLNETEVLVSAGEVSSVKLNIRGDVGIHEFKVCATSKQDSKISSCLNALVKVFKETVDIVVPDVVNLTQREDSKIPIKLRGYGSGLLMISADSFVNSWLNWTSMEVEIPGDYEISIKPAVKGNYTIGLELVTKSDKTYSKNITLLVNPPEIELKLMESIQSAADHLKTIDARLQRFKEAGVEAVLAQSLMEKIADKRAKIEQLLQEGKYAEANALMIELEDLLAKAEEYSNLSVKVAATKPKLNIGSLILGLIALSIGLGGIYYVFSRGPKTWPPPKV